MVLVLRSQCGVVRRSSRCLDITAARLGAASVRMSRAASATASGSVRVGVVAGKACGVQVDGLGPGGKAVEPQAELLSGHGRAMASLAALAQPEALSLMLTVSSSC